MSELQKLILLEQLQLTKIQNEDVANAGEAERW